MFKGMKSLVILSMLVALISSAPTSKMSEHKGRRVLEEMIKHLTQLNNTLSQKIKEKFVVDVKKTCEPTFFCQIQKALKSLNHTEFGTDGVLMRLLDEYDLSIKQMSHHKGNCKIDDNGDQVQLHALLNKMKDCIQKINSKPN